MSNQEQQQQEACLPDKCEATGKCSLTECYFEEEEFYATEECAATTDGKHDVVDGHCRDCCECRSCISRLEEEEEDISQIRDGVFSWKIYMEIVAQNTKKDEIIAQQKAELDAIKGWNMKSLLAGPPKQRCRYDECENEVFICNNVPDWCARWDQRQHEFCSEECYDTFNELC